MAADAARPLGTGHVQVRELRYLGSNVHRDDTDLVAVGADAENWLTIAQAYFKTTSPLTKLPASFQFGNPAVTLTNTFQRTGVAPIPGLWAMP